MYYLFTIELFVVLPFPSTPPRGSGEGASYFKIFLPFTMLMPFCVLLRR